jgi:hypothetical protein
VATVTYGMLLHWYVVVVYACHYAQTIGEMNLQNCIVPCVFFDTKLNVLLMIYIKEQH